MAAFIGEDFRWEKGLGAVPPGIWMTMCVNRETPSVPYFPHSSRGREGQSKSSPHTHCVQGWEKRQRGMKKGDRQFMRGQFVPPLATFFPPSTPSLP